MKKYIKPIVFFLTLLVFILYIIYWCFYDMNRLPKGELINELASPNNEYTIKTYIVNGGATVSYSIRAELIFNKANKKPRNIYWNYKENEAIIQWLGDSTVVINGHLLRVPKEVYDWRREKKRNFTFD